MFDSGNYAADTLALAVGNPNLSFTIQNNQQNGRGQTDLSEDTTIKQLDLYQILRATGQIEALLGLTAHTKCGRPQKKPPIKSTPPGMVDDHDLFNQEN